MANELIGTTEVMKILGVSRDTVIRLIYRGELPYAQKRPGPSGAYLFDPWVVELFARQQAKAAS